MSMILIMEANPEKLQVRLMRFCMIIRRRFAIVGPVHGDDATFLLPALGDPSCGFP